MKILSITLLLFFAVIPVLAAPNFPLVGRDVDPTLVPEFGHQAGLNPTGTGDCDGITNPAGVVVKIPCFCPPNRADFLQSLNANVDAGRVVNNPGIPVSFPTDNNKPSKLARMNAAIVTLQNLRGPGAGCPAASTTFVAQLKAIQAGTDTSTPQAVPSAAPSPLPGVDPALVPEFGHQAGLNPTGSGDCDGITNAAGKVVKVPCFCPPDRSVFIQSLNDNVVASHAVNNTGIAVSFPTDDDKVSRLARINAALVTLQNLRGPGIGCPAASTTFVAQQQAILNS